MTDERITKPNHPQVDLSGKTALVTGASRGIGYAMAKTLAKAGAHVLALARTVGGLEELDDAIKSEGGSVSLIPADLNDADAIDKLGPALAERHEKLDILFSNAALLGELAPLADIDPKIWDLTIATNISANWRIIRAVDPLLRASKGARVVFTTSSAAEVARPFWGLYAVTKAALDMMAKTYALEIEVAGGKVAILDPGAMRTGMRAQAAPGEDPAVLPHPDELSPLMMYAVSPDYDGQAERLVFRDWRAQGRV